MSTETEDMTDAWGQTWDADDRVALGPAPTAKTDDGRKPLAPRQAVVVAAIHGLTAANGIPPTVRELTEAMNIRSPHGVHCHFAALVRKGYLRKPRYGVSRDLVLLPPKEAR